MEIILGETDLLFVGGGPVGLWTAAQVKLQNPELNVTILEKHQEYKCFYVLSLHPSSFKEAVTD